MSAVVKGNTKAQQNTGIAGVIAATSQETLKAWSFDWSLLDVLVNGRSSIDLPRLSLSNWDEATAFLKIYGAEPDQPDDQLRIRHLINEALDFIKDVLMPEEWTKGLMPPSEVMSVRDIRQLLLFASQPPRTNRVMQVWSCAILRIIHSLAHISYFGLEEEIQFIKEQVRERFFRHIHREGEKIFLGDKETVWIELSRLDWKDEKTRSSILLKLLHKTGNVAETIYDHFGIRIIVKNLYDVFRTMEYIRKHYLISLPNCVPARARNSLVDFTKYREQVTTLLKELSEGEISVENYYQKLSQSIQYFEIAPSKEDSANPHSSKFYRSMQITCREYLKPNFQANSEVSEKKGLGGIFFPFEIQLTDEKSFDENNEGLASHSSYKMSQLKTARKRVLSQVLKLK